MAHKLAMSTTLSCFLLYFISDDGSGYPKWNVLPKQAANIETSIVPRQHTDSNIFPEHGGRHFVSQINRCDSVTNKRIVTSYSDVAKKLVPTSKNINDGDKLAFKSGSINDGPQTDAKDKNDSIEKDITTNDKDKDNNSSMGDMEKLCEESHDPIISETNMSKTESGLIKDSETIVSSTLTSLNTKKHEDDKDETRILEGGSFSYENDKTISLGSNLVAFPYMQVRFFILYTSIKLIFIYRNLKLYIFYSK